MLGLALLLVLLLLTLLALGVLGLVALLGLGGGLVSGSVVLLSGEPGIGKSTLLLQISDSIGQSRRVLYISGEESGSQIKLRANRLKVSGENLFIRVLAEHSRPRRFLCHFTL